MLEFLYIERGLLRRFSGCHTKNYNYSKWQHAGKLL